MRSKVLSDLQAIDRSLRSLRDQFLPYLNSGIATAAQLGRLILSHLVNDMDHHMTLKQVQVERQQQAVQDAKQEFELMKDDRYQDAWVEGQRRNCDEEFTDNQKAELIKSRLTTLNENVQRVLDLRNTAWAQAMNMMELKKIINMAIDSTESAISTPKTYELRKIQLQYVEIFYQREEMINLLHLLDSRLRYHNVDSKYVMPTACTLINDGVYRCREIVGDDLMDDDSSNNVAIRPSMGSSTSDNIMNIMRGEDEYVPSIPRMDGSSVVSAVNMPSSENTSCKPLEKNENSTKDRKENVDIDVWTTRNKNRLILLFAAYRQYINDMKALAALKACVLDERHDSLGCPASSSRLMTLKDNHCSSNEDLLLASEQLIEAAEIQNANDEISLFTNTYDMLCDAHLKTQLFEISKEIEMLASISTNLR
eukprot:CFRG3084T1